MVTAITEGVKISVETTYQDEYSNPGDEHFMFAYRIHIENLTSNTIQLISREWIIFDSCGIQRTVEGDGVVGLQPILEPGDSHSYVSGCHLSTDIGNMYGSYLMERLMDNSQFRVSIPQFELIVPFRLN